MLSSQVTSWQYFIHIFYICLLQHLTEASVYHPERNIQTETDAFFSFKKLKKDFCASLYVGIEDWVKKYSVKRVTFINNTAYLIYL